MLLLAALPVILSWMAMRKERKRGQEKGEEKEEEEATKKVPSHYGNLTKDQLKGYTGKDESKPLLVGINGKIYDVTSVSAGKVGL